MRCYPDPNPHYAHTCPIDEQVSRFVAAQYLPSMTPGLRQDPPLIINRRSNPHLSHHCESPEFEVFANCKHDDNPKHTYEELVDVQYDNRGYQCLVAIASCGFLEIWMD